MTNSDGNDSRDKNPATNTALGSGTLPSQLVQALLTEGLVSAERLNVEYECMAAQLNVVSASLFQAATATPPRVASGTLDEL